MNLFRRTPVEHEPKGENLPVPSPSEASFGNLKIEIHGTVNFTEKEKIKFAKAMELGHQVINSVEFKEKIINCQFSEARGLSNQQIWELICTGKDLYNEEDDHDIDVFITMYENFWTGTVGYTYPNTFKTWVNRKFFSRFDESEILGNVIHEAMHNFGFDHLVKAKKLESVPYQIGYIARDLGNEIMKGKTLTPLKVGV